MSSPKIKPVEYDNKYFDYEFFPKQTVLPQFPVNDPGKETLTYGDECSIMGLVNTKNIKIPFPVTKKVLQRFGVIFPSSEQGVVEIWNNSAESEPIFSKTWQDLQLIYMKQTIYHGKVTMMDRSVHLFRLGQRRKNTRFIWLSAPNFWENPIRIKNEYILKENDPEINSFPEANQRSDGVLNKSVGSRFGTFFQDPWRSELHSEYDFSPYTFPMIEKYFQNYNKIVSGNTKQGFLRKSTNQDTEKLFNR